MGQAIGLLLGSALGAGASIFGATSAAHAQTAAVNKAIAMQLAMFGSGKQALNPAIRLMTGSAGHPGAAQMIRRAMTPGTGLWNRFMRNIKPTSLTAAQARATPGYQFVLDQGLKSVQNQFAARGLGSSGAAMKGAENFATGLADQTYNTRFQQAAQQWQQQQTNRSNAFQRLFGTAELGTNAAANLFSGSMQTGGNIGNMLVGAGNAQGAAYTSAGNTVGNLFGQAGGYSYLQPYLNQMFRGGQTGQQY